MRGDHIKVRRKLHILPLYYHHGIEIEDNKVIHYGEGSLITKKNSAVTISSMEDFLKGGKKEVVKDENSSPPTAVVKRAKSQLGEKNYNIVFNNCEHFAHWAATGKKQSPQVKTVGKVAAAASVLGVVAGVMLKKGLREEKDIIERIDLLLEKR